MAEDRQSSAHPHSTIPTSFIFAGNFYQSSAKMNEDKPFWHHHLPVQYLVGTDEDKARFVDCWLCGWRWARFVDCGLYCTASFPTLKSLARLSFVVRCRFQNNGETRFDTMERPLCFVDIFGLRHSIRP